MTNAPPPLADLVAELADAQVTVRRTALRRLHHWYGKRALPQFEHGLHDRSGMVRDAVVSALLELHDPHLVARLLPAPGTGNAAVMPSPS